MNPLYVIGLAGVGLWAWNRARRRKKAWDQAPTNGAADNGGSAVPSGLRPGIHNAAVGVDVLLAPPSGYDFVQGWAVHSDTVWAEADLGTDYLRSVQPQAIEVRFLVPGSYEFYAEHWDPETQSSQRETWVFHVPSEPLGA